MHVLSFPGANFAQKSWLQAPVALIANLKIDQFCTQDAQIR